MKRLIPNTLRLLRVRLLWFLKNFKNIRHDSYLITNELDGPVTYAKDGLITSHNCDFLQDDKFKKAFAVAAATNPWPGFNLEWRTYIVCWYAQQASKLVGDFVECGVNTGAYARAVIEYIDFKNTSKTFFLLDTFEGLVEKQISEKEKKSGISKYINSYRNTFNEVQNTFRDFNVRLIKGTVPDTLPQCTAEKVCFLSIDMNCVEPEIAAANYFWDKIVKGGVIILDDYGFAAHIHQKLAFDNFAASKKTSILCLPTGQGIIIKNE